MDYHKIATSTTLKVLSVFKKERLYVNQIAELTHIKSKSNLLAALGKLTSANILKREETRGNTFYALNYENGISLALLQLLCTFKLYRLPFEHRKAIEETVQNAMPAIAFLFGSTAKGTFTKESDIDLLLVYKDHRNIHGLEIAKQIGKKYGVTINPVIIQMTELRQPNESLKHILETGYPIAGHLYFYGIYKRI